VSLASRPTHPCTGHTAVPPRTPRLPRSPTISVSPPGPRNTRPSVRIGTGAPDLSRSPLPGPFRTGRPPRLRAATTSVSGARGSPHRSPKRHSPAQLDTGVSAPVPIAPALPGPVHSAHLDCEAATMSRSLQGLRTAFAAGWLGRTVLLPSRAAPLSTWRPQRATHTSIMKEKRPLPTSYIEDLHPRTT